MAKRTCARAEGRARERAPARKPARAQPPSPLRYVYTPELLAHGRHRYEHTEDSIADIALDFGIHKTTFQRMANRERWVRFNPPPRDLPAAVKLAAQAEALVAQTGWGGAANAGAFPPPESASCLPPRARGSSPAEGGRVGVAPSDAEVSLTPTPIPSPQGGGEESAAREGQEQQAPAQEALPSPAITAERLHRDVLNELAAVERMRALLDAEPQSPLDAERTSRTLSSLTATLQRIQRMQAGLPATGADDDDDDLPADPDAFRDALAQKIEAFLASTPDEDDAGPVAAAGPDPARP